MGQTQNQTTAAIKDVSYTRTMQQKMLDYGMSVIKARAFPDIRDGMKPVQRRILWTMYEDKYLPQTPYRKSASIVGAVMGRYHPHGDSGIYTALVHLAQPFNNQLPLLDPHGNFGSIDGDDPAAMRYTEARLSEMGLKIVGKSNPQIVPFVDNFDGTREMPEVLAAQLPILLINGVQGVGVAISTYIPQHNPAEVIKAFIAFLDNPQISLDDLLTIMPGPDFPVGGEVINKDELRDFYQNGTGRIVVRSTVKFDAQKHILHLTSIPFTSANNKEGLLTSIADKVSDRSLPEVVSLEDLSDEKNNSIDIQITVKKDTDIADFLQRLYHYTKVQGSTTLSFNALIGNHVSTYNLKKYFQEYLAFQMEITKKEFLAQQQELQHKLEVIQGNLQIIDLLDPIIDLLKNASNQKQMRAALQHGDITGINFTLKKHARQVQKFAFTATQTENILAMPLRRLSHLSKLSLEKQQHHLTTELHQVQKIVNSPAQIRSTVKTRHEQLLPLVERPRRTLIHQLKTTKFVPTEANVTVRVLVDKYYYVHSTNDFKSPAPAQTIGDYQLSTQQKLAFITNKGNIYDLKIKQLKTQALKHKGESINSLLNFAADEYALQQLPTTAFQQQDLLLITKKGLGKILPMADYVQRTRTKSYVIKLNPQDELAAVVPVADDQAWVTMFSEFGYYKKVKVSAFSKIGKQGKGNVVFRLLEEMDNLSQVVINAQPVVVNGQSVNTQDLPLMKLSQKAKLIN